MLTEVVPCVLGREKVGEREKMKERKDIEKNIAYRSGSLFPPQILFLQLREGKPQHSLRQRKRESMRKREK